MISLNCDFIFSGLLNSGQFSILAFCLVIAFVLAFLKNTARSRVGKLGIFLLVTGSTAISFERYRNGCVADYLNFFNLFYFNLQDLLITTGIILIAWTIYREK